MKAAEIISVIESFSPSGIQEQWDNSGLLAGDPETDVKAVLLCLDITEEVMDEAGELGCNMIISHHPLVFKGLRRFTGNDPVSRMLRKAIKNDLVVFSAHTNLDQVPGGVSGAMADRLGLTDREILVPRQDDLMKLVTFIPGDHFSKVTEAVFRAGAGHIGNYDSCGFSSDGEGSFRAGEGSNPFAGSRGELHYEPEKRFETILPVHLRESVVSALLQSHPYEEVAYDLYHLANENTGMGLGVAGLLPEPLNGTDFLDLVKREFETGCIRYSALPLKPVSKVAVMGGSGSEYLGHAIRIGADAYITADIKYHQFFNPDGKILLMDIGHFESEQVAIGVLNKLLLKKITNFAVHLSKINTNPINYY